MRHLIFLFASVLSFQSQGALKVDGDFYGISLGMDEVQVRNVLVEKGWTIILGDVVVSKGSPHIKIKQGKLVDALDALKNQVPVCMFLPGEGKLNADEASTMKLACVEKEGARNQVAGLTVNFYFPKLKKGEKRDFKVYSIGVVFNPLHEKAKDIGLELVGKFGKSADLFQLENCSPSLTDQLKVPQDNSKSCFDAFGFNLKKDYVVEIEGLGSTLGESKIIKVFLKDHSLTQKANDIARIEAKSMSKKMGF